MDHFAMTERLCRICGEAIRLSHGDRWAHQLHPDLLRGGPVSSGTKVGEWGLRIAGHDATPQDCKGLFCAPERAQHTLTCPQHMLYEPPAMIRDDFQDTERELRDRWPDTQRDDYER